MSDEFFKPFLQYVYENYEHTDELLEQMAPLVEHNPALVPTFLYIRETGVINDDRTHEMIMTLGSDTFNWFEHLKAQYNMDDSELISYMIQQKINELNQTSISEDKENG